MIDVNTYQKSTYGNLRKSVICRHKLHEQKISRMKDKTSILIIAIVLVALIIFVYKYSVPAPGEYIGPPVKDTTTVVLDSASHSVSIEK